MGPHGGHDPQDPSPPRYDAWPTAAPPRKTMPPSSAKKVLAILVVVLALGAVAAAGTVAGIFWWYARGIKEFDEEGLRNYRPPQVTRILSRDGEVIGEIYTQRRTLIRYSDIPSHVENAFLAAEDADFYRHEGMDVLGMARALFVNIKAGEVRQGASTITQQVVKIFLLSPEQTLERKVQELVLARRLEQAFTKREILELYLNEIYLGHGRYGIEEAAQFYFGKSVRDIDIGQAALLATLPKAPGRDSPIRNPDHSKKRQIWVLEQMVSHELASRAQVQPFIDGGLGLVDESKRVGVHAGAEEFVDEARAQLEAQYGADALPYLGARVTTTVSLAAQAAARAAVLGGLRELDTRQSYGHGLKPAKAKVRAQAEMHGDAPIAVGQTYVAVVDAPDGSLKGRAFAAKIGKHRVYVRVPEGSRYAEPDVAIDRQFPQDAVIDVRIELAAGAEGSPAPAGMAVAEIDEGPEAALVVADTESGEVVAMIGGSSYATGEFNRAARAARQPGSTFKPFVYGAALESKQFSAATLVSDSPEIYEKWRPTNFEPDVYRGDIRLREALASSVNTIAIKLVDRIGIDTVREFATRAGVQTPQPNDLSIALGTGEVTPLELLGGYMTIARHGSRIRPIVIRRIELPGGSVVTPPVVAEQVIAEDVAFVLTSMMTSVVQSGTGTKAKALGRPVAGKTGTSAEHHDAWFAGFTPKTVAVAWVGFDRPRPLGKSETGGRAAIPIWVEAVKAIETGEAASFTPPASVSVRRIDATSGLLAPPEAGDMKTLDEFFVAGTEPVDEAIVGSKPTGETLLDLYDDPGAAPPAGDDVPPAEPDAPPTDAADGLPSIADLPD
jgi:penicillin-binding protein 1A